MCAQNLRYFLKFLKLINRNELVAVMAEVSISLDKAIELCHFYRDKNRARLFSQCWGCLRFSKGQSEKMCFFKPPNNNGCVKVNEMFRKTT